MTGLTESLAAIVSSRPTGAIAQLRKSSYFISVCAAIVARLYSRNMAKYTMKAARLESRIMSGSQGRVRTSDGAMRYSDPHLSASAPTIGPVKNVGADAATEKRQYRSESLQQAPLTVDKADEVGFFVPRLFDV